MNELVALENLTPAIVFAHGGGDPIVEKIRKEVMSVDRDISTPEGRKNIASLAYKVARSKTFIDEMGKTFAADLKKQTKAIDTERARIWDALEDLQKTVRAPLTDFEEKEKNRIENLENQIILIGQFGFYSNANWQTQDFDEMKSGIDKIAKIFAETEWDEYLDRAKSVHQKALAEIVESVAKREKHISDQAELERLRAAEAARLQVEREERLKSEAAEKAKREAEEKGLAATKEAEAKAARELAEQKAKEEKALREKADAEERERKAIADKKEAEERAERDKKEAASKAERDKLAAVEAERKRAEDAKKAEDAATAAREADKKHRSKVNNEALHALLSLIFSDDPDVMTETQKTTGMNVIKAIARGEVPHVKISY